MKIKVIKVKQIKDKKLKPPRLVLNEYRNENIT